MKFIARDSQNALMGVKHRDSYSRIDDDFFDGEIPRLPLKVKNWRAENSLHSSEVLSIKIDSTRNFIGQNTNIIRDDLRKRTITSFIHNNGELKVVEFDEAGLKSKQQFLLKNAVRSDITLDKYTGKVYVCCVHNLNTENETNISFDGTVLNTIATRPDFPSFSISQVPIGHIPDCAFSYGVLIYKCRDSGKSYIRRFENGKMGQETVLSTPEIIGGGGIVISGDEVIIRVDSYIDGKLVPMLSRSTDKAVTFSEFSSVDLPYGDEFDLLPASAPPIQDFSGSFHVPIGVASDKETIALDYILDHALVEAIRVNEPKDLRAYVGKAAFPKTSACNLIEQFALRFGDGVTDGIGIISTLKVNGKLYSSNSQSGGISYPKHVHLNHEMPDICALSHTECYTRWETPNTVSMDYLYIESSIEGEPISPDLHFETWDMPLPKPVSRAVSDGDNITITIEKDANFFHGRCIVKFEDPMIEVLELTIHEVRKANLIASSSNLKGKTLIIEVLSQFHHHKIEVIIE